MWLKRWYVSNFSNYQRESQDVIYLTFLKYSSIKKVPEYPMTTSKMRNCSLEQSEQHSMHRDIGT
uniref:Uncharacterized protein n=1 Tax=Zea mays TaxID=4577 RepID=A0A804NG50_MAIZE